MLGFSKKSDKSVAVSSSKPVVTGASMEGILKRKNRHGEWKERYCKFNSSQFLAYKTAKGKATGEMKECYSLKEIVTAELNAKNQLLVTLLNGEQSLFKGDNIEAWKQSILDLSEEANEIHQETIAQAAGSVNSVSISGYLLKQSHNKYQGYQERFVRLEGTSLKYYKKEGDTQESGVINILIADFIRPFSDDENCKIFEIADQDDRVYAFQARNFTEMMRWIQTLNTVRNAAIEKVEEEKAAKLEAETPERIRFYDNEGEGPFKELYREQLMEMYPDPESLTMTIKMHTQYATEVVQYLKDLIPELQAVGNRPARYDILAVAMTETNFVLTERLKFFLEPTFDDGTNDEGNNYLHHILENANLGELHMLINWISKYQSTLRSIRCPVCTPGSPASTSQARLSVTHLNPKQCDVFNFIQRICKLYVHGGSTGAKGGAAEHLVDHCQKVWNSVANNPEEMLQRHNNGTFFTEAPIQMWMAINQHISLATSTNSPILHVMIAEKVVTSLISIFDHIITYIQTLDTTQRPELREIELEYISALANDTALHIEDVIELIENFTIPEIREKIDEIFDPLTTTLFQCGQTCLKRLAGLVMADVQNLLDQVFEEEWIEGNQMRVATATISDYMRDFQEFLVPFWADKFVMTILEEVILAYTRTLLFRKDQKKSVTTTVTTTDPNNTPGSPSVGGMFSSFFQKTKQTITQTITTQVPTHVPVDEESLGRLAQDVNILNAFFSLKAGQEIATEFLQLINEVSLLLFIDVPGIIQHIAVRVSEYPSAAQAIHDVAMAVMKLRYEDFTKADMDYVSQQVRGILVTAPADAQRQENEGIVEGRLGLLYFDVVPKEPGNGNGTQKLTLAQRMKVMANIPLFGAAARTIMGEDEDEEDIDKMDNEETANTTNAAGDKLLKDVLNVLNEQEPDSFAQDNAYAQEQAKQEAEEAARKAKLLYYEGYLEKKSPAHNLWQRRFYKLMTREVDNPDKPFLYTLLWYKKEGGSLIKALEIDKIASLAVVQTARNMAYVMPPKSQVMLMSEATSSGLHKCSIPVMEMDHEENRAGESSKAAALVVKQEFFTFVIIQTDGKEHILRGLKVDRVMKWINTISQAGGFAYDSVSRSWTRAAFEHFKMLEREKRLPQPEAPLPLLSSPVAVAARRRTLSNASLLDDVTAAMQQQQQHQHQQANQPVATPAASMANPKQVRGSIVNTMNNASSSNASSTNSNPKLGVKELLQSLQDEDDADPSENPVVSARKNSNNSSKSHNNLQSTSHSEDYDGDEAAVVAARLRQQSSSSTSSAPSELKVEKLKAQSYDESGDANEPQYMTEAEEANIRANNNDNNGDESTIQVKRRGSSVALMFSALTSAITGGSADDATNNNNNNTTSSSSTIDAPLASPKSPPQQRRSFTLFSSPAPPPPPADSSPKPTNTASNDTSNRNNSSSTKPTAAALLAVEDSSDEDKGKNDGGDTKRKTSDSDTVNPIFRKNSSGSNNSNNNSPSIHSPKRGSVSTENPLAGNRPSLSAQVSNRSIRKTAPPPPPPPPASTSPAVVATAARTTPAAKEEDEDNDKSAEREDSICNDDRETQAWPSQSNPTSNNNGTKRTSIAKRAAQNRVRQSVSQAATTATTTRPSVAPSSTDNNKEVNNSERDDDKVTSTTSNNGGKKKTEDLDMADSSSSNKSAIAGAAAASTKAPAKVTNTTTTTNNLNNNYHQSTNNNEDDIDRFSVMTVDLDSNSSTVNKSAVNTSNNNSNNFSDKKRQMQSFDIQDDDHHSDKDKLLADKKPAGCPCVIS